MRDRLGCCQHKQSSKVFFSYVMMVVFIIHRKRGGGAVSKLNLLCTPFQSLQQ